MKRIGFLLFTLALTSTLTAQPPARIRQQAGQNTARSTQPTSQTATTTSSGRAELEFPVQADMPEDVVWRRDIYRKLDLTTDKNAVLYYPTKPKGDQMNLFTYLFKMVLRGQIKAYDYTLDGNEDFEDRNQIKPKAILDKFGIYYETKDNRLRITDADLPSEDVKAYFIKESAYYDQRTATYHTKVVALCPVMVGADTYGLISAPRPMFWVKYDDSLSQLLAKLPVTGSNLNNASSLSADDYFTMNLYDGKIYKTNNLQGRLLSDYATSDTAMVKEQKRIEKQLTDFEQHIWGNDSTGAKAKSAADSTSAKSAKSADKKSETKSTRRGSTRRSSTVKAQKSSSAKSGGSGAARVTVRRQRH